MTTTAIEQLTARLIESLNLGASGDPYLTCNAGKQDIKDILAHVKDLERRLKVQESLNKDYLCVISYNNLVVKGVKVPTYEEYQKRTAEFLARSVESKSAKQKLAELLGWTGVHLLPVLGLNTSMTDNVRKKVYVGTDSSGKPNQVPDWCGSWNAAGPLIREYNVDVMHSWNHVYFRDSKDSHTRKDVSAIEAGDVVDQIKLDEQMRIGIVEATIQSIETDLEIMKEKKDANDTVPTT